MPSPLLKKLFLDQKQKKRAALEMDIKNMWNARLLGLGGGFKYAFILTPMMGYLWQLHVEEEWSWNWFFLSIFVHVKKLMEVISTAGKK